MTPNDSALLQFSGQSRVGGSGLLLAAEHGKAGVIGLLVVIALIAAAVFLFRSMNRQLRRVPKSFDRPPEGGVDRPPEGGDELPEDQSPEGR